MNLTVDLYFKELSLIMQCLESQLQEYYNDLILCSEFLEDINKTIKNVPEFNGVQFSHPNELRVYRCLLYLFTRIVKPVKFVETGVHNGFSSAFILLAMKHNKKGTLYSIDIPPVDERIIAQGTRPLPKSKTIGWIIPKNLLNRHELHLGPSELLLPKLLHTIQPISAFLHDSDHCFQHMMFELSLAWRYVSSNGWLLCDNIEQNSAFFDFAKGINSTSYVIASFNNSERVWKHGLIKKSV